MMKLVMISIVMLALNGQQMLCVWLVLLKTKIYLHLTKISKNSVKIVLKMYVPISKMISLKSSMILVINKKMEMILSVACQWMLHVKLAVLDNH